MIVGIGNDIIEIDRVERAVSNERFVLRNFTAAERALFASKGDACQTIALNFAVKEALVKALGTGFRQLSLCDIAVLRDSLGKPYIEPSPKLTDVLNAQNINRLHVSGSHSRHYATAVVVVEHCEEL